jgi:hypothetical protein
MRGVPTLAASGPIAISHLAKFGSSVMLIASRDSSTVFVSAQLSSSDGLWLQSFQSSLEGRKSVESDRFPGLNEVCSMRNSKPTILGR